MNIIIKIDDNNKLEELQKCLFDCNCYWNEKREIINNLKKYNNFFIICFNNKLTITFSEFGIYRIVIKKCVRFNSINEFLRYYKLKNLL